MMDTFLPDNYDYNIEHKMLTICVSLPCSSAVVTTDGSSCITYVNFSATCCENNRTAVEKDKVEDQPTLNLLHS